MEILRLTPENLAREHICCAISDRKGDDCVSAKKAWMAERFAEGLAFQKLDVRGKAFIEYIPAENAWCPVGAVGYTHIHCFWVSGQFKGQGHANRLLEACVQDAKAAGKHGVTALSSRKKLPFLSDPQYLKYKGFQVADRAAPSYELLYLPFDRDAPVPAFKPCAKEGRTTEPGLALYYSHQCPHTAKYAPLARAVAQKMGASMKLIRFETAGQAQASPAPFTAYSLFADGKLVTHEILSEKKLEALLESLKNNGNNWPRA